MTPERAFDVDDLAQEIRKVDGNHCLGAGALAEALAPWLERTILRARLHSEMTCYLRRIRPSGGDCPTSLMLQMNSR